MPRMKNFCTVAILFPLLVFINQVNADPIIGVSARTQFFQGSALRSFVEVSREASGGQELHVIQAPIIFGYNPLTDMVVNVVVPYVNKEFKDQTGKRFGASGVADISISGKYRFYREDVPRGSTQFAVLGGLELPTGDTTKRKDGIRLPRPLQLGSGGVDPSVGIAASWISAFHSLDGGVQFKYNARHSGFRFGTVTRYDLSYAYGTYPKWPVENAQLSFLLELNGEHRERNLSGSNKVRASGGDTIFLSPGIQYIFLDNVLVEASFQYPIIDRVNSQQLNQDYRFLLGFRVAF